MAVAPGQTVLFQFDVGASPKLPGVVTLDLGWTDGFPGVDSGTENHNSTPLCGPTTTT